MKVLRVDEIRPFTTKQDPERRRRTGGKGGAYIRPEHPVASLDHVSRVVEEPTLVEDRHGNPLLVYTKLTGDDVHAGEELRAVLNGVKFSVSNRSTGMKSRCVTFGFLPRIEFRQDYCHVCRLAYENPLAHKVLCDFGNVADRLYQKHLPAIRAGHVAQVQAEVKPDWRMGDTPYTSGIVNDNSALHYHRDGGNFPGRWNCMLVLKQDARGGELVVPELDLALRCGDMSVSFFHASQAWHGVTPIRRKRGGHRYSIVYYALRKLRLCMTPAEELARIKAKTAERERAKRPGWKPK